MGFDSCGIGRYESLSYLQWKAFSRTVRKIEIDFPLITAVYDDRAGALVLPGSNLKRYPAKLKHAHGLAQVIKESCPNPKDLKDDYAASVACRYFLEPSEEDKRHKLLVAPVRRGRGNPQAHIGDIKKGHYRQSDVRLTWPPEFQNFLGNVFGREFDCGKVMFAACPLSSEVNGGQHFERFVAFFYFQISGELLLGRKEILKWMPRLRELMAWGLLAHETEKASIRKIRFDRINSPGNEETVAKFAAGEGGKSIVAQAKFFGRMARNLPPHSNLLVPKVTLQKSFSSAHIPHYKMPRYHLPSVRSLLLGANHPSKKELRSILTRLLESIFHDLYVRNRRPGNVSWARREVKSRVNRLSDIEETLLQIERGAPVSVRGAPQIVPKKKSHALLRRLLMKNPAGEAPIEVADPEFNIRRAHQVIAFPWETLAGSETLKRLRPPFFTTIHGDLHFDNILVDSYFPEDPFFVLIDPRGGNSIGDPACDIAKLLFSCEAGYDFVDTRHFDVDSFLDHSKNKHVVNIELPSEEVSIQGMSVGASIAGLASIGKTLPPGTREIYVEAATIIRQCSRELGRDLLQDEDLLGRADFFMGLFCLVMAESHYPQNPDGALAMMSRGCRVLADWKK